MEFTKKNILVCALCVGALAFFLVGDNTHPKNNPVIFEFYGKHCGPCKFMKPMIDSFETTEQVRVVRYEVWYNKENEQLRKKYATGHCAVVPFFVNPATGDYICGVATYEELKKLAGK